MAPRKRLLEDSGLDGANRSAKARTTSDRLKAKGAESQSRDDMENLDPEPARDAPRTDDDSQPAVETASESEETDTDDEDKIPMEDENPYEYILMVRPQFDIEAENDAKLESEQKTEEELDKLWKKQYKAIPHDTAAATRPDHKWVLMRGAWIRFATAMREASYRCPDNFNMYFYNDFEGYGLLELIENHIQAFATEYAKKDGDLRNMWIPLVGLIHFMKTNQMAPLAMIDDGERHEKMITFIGCAYLTMLNSLDREGQLKPGSDFQDVGLVSALYLTLTEDYADSYNATVLDWRRFVKDYMDVQKIDTSFVFGSDPIETSDVALSDRKGIPRAGPDRWGFKKRAYKRSYTGARLGGTHYDITKMSRAQRAAEAFDKRDPLADVPDKALREGLLMFR